MVSVKICGHYARSGIQGMICTFLLAMIDCFNCYRLSLVEIEHRCIPCVIA